MFIMAGFIGTCRMCPDVSGIGGFVGIYQDLSEFVGICWDVSECVGMCRDLTRFGGICRDFAKICWNGKGVDTPP